MIYLCNIYDCVCIGGVEPLALLICDTDNPADSALAVFEALHYDPHEELDAHEAADEDEEQIHVVAPDLLVPHGLHVNAYEARKQSLLYYETLSARCLSTHRCCRRRSACCRTSCPESPK